MNPDDIQVAGGAPGIEARWTSSAKDGVGTAASAASRVWFALSHGILNEIYYPRLDQADTRDLGLIVTDGTPGYVCEEKRHADQVTEWIEDGVPAFRVTSACRQGRYRIVKTILTDPTRDVLLQRIEFTPLRGRLADYHVFALLAPHLGNRGAGNTAWLGDYKGWPMLFAERADTALALAARPALAQRACGYVGASDGWQDLTRHGKLTWLAGRAPDGNVALTAELDLSAGNGRVDLALGFGLNPAEAGLRARLSLTEGFDVLLESYAEGWRAVQRRCGSVPEAPLARTSVAVLATHAAKRFPGGMIASLSIPWGFSKGDDDLGGYHLVWPRDLVETAGGMLAAGDAGTARDTLCYLAATQEADGRWPQNMWMDGTPYWGSVQMDEVALPILLADLLARHAGLGDCDPLPLVRAAAGYLVRNGPASPQDRWEENGGYSPFTLAAEIAALLAAADFLEAAGDSAAATYLRETADAWNDSIERWVYVRGTDLARRVGVDGYYVRIGTSDAACACSPVQGWVPIKNRPPGQDDARMETLVSPDALALVRFGLRAPDDPRVLATVKVIDAMLRTETVTGPVWHRYNGDGYGEKKDGAAFDGQGIGRGWPLLAGERAHYELAVGRPDAARALLSVMERQAGAGRLIPEQVWDAADVPARELFNGRPSGSAMPLAWAHAEYLKLARSLADGAVFDTPQASRRRYVLARHAATHALWKPNLKCRAVAAGRTLRVELPAPARVHWSVAGGPVRTTPTRDTGLGVHVADLAPAPLRFGFDGQDYEVGAIEEGACESG